MQQNPILHILHLAYMVAGGYAILRLASESRR